MASAKDLRKRITSVKNTQQITKAMKMVSAAKLRRAQENVFAVRPYALEMLKVISALSETLKDDESHPLLRAPKENPDSILMVVVTSDRGLCGAFNGNVIKTVQRILKTESSRYKKFDLAFIGKRGYEFFKSKKTGKNYPSFFTGLNILKSKGLAEELCKLYLDGEYDEIKIVYNEFVSALTQKTNTDSFLPVKLEGLPKRLDSPFIKFEPNSKEILEKLLPQHFTIQIHRVLLESLAGEFAARMAAMENATQNAGEMIRKITLLYNKTRQAGITKELLEIVSGSEAQKG